ncbi:hypothetical protein PALU110988_18205 [Paenibacillus lupini]|nr:hypothetical protein [Paenibacillus lupini]
MILKIRAWVTIGMDHPRIQFRRGISHSVYQGKRGTKAFSIVKGTKLAPNRYF